MTTIKRHLQGWEHGEWIFPAFLFLMIMLGTLGPGSYFLHFDTPTLSQNAADLVLGGCWGTSGKPGVSLLLSILFLLGGVDPLWDMVMLTVLGMVMLTCFYSLARYFVKSRRWALLGTLWFASLPIILYYSRFHIGYPLAFFVLGMALQVKKQYGWAGLAFGMVPITHTNFLVPLTTWLGSSFILYQGKTRFRDFIRLGIALLVPILILEITRFLFMGEPFSWSRSLFNIVQKHGARTYHTSWAHIPVVVSTANGLPNALLLLTGIAYPLVRERKISLLDAVYLASWSVIAAYTLWVGIWHKELAQRMIAGVYPMLAIGSLVTVMRTGRRIGKSLSNRNQKFYRLAGALIVAVILPMSFTNHLLDATVASRTAYPQVEQTMIRAAEAGLPVRYFGNFHVGYFFALVHQVETNINEPSLDVITGDTRSVLIFEDVGGKTPNSIPAVLEDDPRINPSDYEIVTYAPHITAYPPANTEGRAGTARTLALARELSPPRSDNASRGMVTVWWPREPEGTFQARHEPLEFVFHYDGGCITPRRFGDENYYHTLADKATILWEAIRIGNFEEVVDLVTTWVQE